MTSRGIRSELVVFHGHVQGVGFRFTALRHARHHDLAGWVRNDPQGTVTAHIRGPLEALEAWLEQIECSLPGHVDRIHRRELAGTDEFTGFRILRS